MKKDGDGFDVDELKWQKTGQWQKKPSDIGKLGQVFDGRSINKGHKHYINKRNQLNGAGLYQQVTRFSKISKSTIKITIDWMSN